MTYSSVVEEFRASEQGQQIFFLGEARKEYAMDLSKIEATDDLSVRQVRKLLKTIGIEGITEILQGKGKIIIKIEKIAQVLFDKHGRRIPEGLSANVCDADRNFQLKQPKLKKEVDYADRILRLQECLDVDTKITAKQFKGETDRLLAMIQDNSRIANITNGVWLPVILPQLTTDDLGTALEQYLKVVGKSYIKTFGDRKFFNHRESTLANEVNIVDGSRHDQLIKRMKQGPVIGIHFPNPLQGFSIKASCEQMSTLPEGFILSGMDTPIAMAMYPDILACYSAPNLDMAALSWRSANSSFYFESCDDKLDLGITGLLGSAFNCYSGGLLFLG